MDGRRRLSSAQLALPDMPESSRAKKHRVKSGYVQPWVYNIP